MSAHIAIFLPSLRGGGAERVMTILANDFAERGHKVDLVLAKSQGPFLADVAENVHIVDLSASRVLASIPPLVRYLRKERPDGMLSAVSHANLAAIAALTLSRTKTRLVVSEHSHFSASTKNVGKIRKTVKKYLLKMTYPKTADIIAVSNGVAADLEKNIGLPHGKVKTICNPVVNKTMLERSHEVLSHPWFQLGEPPVILGAGRLSPSKDFHLLIRAFAQLRSQRTARLVILGEGALRPELEKLVVDLGLGKEVSFPGFVNNPYAYMRRAALFVLSSRWEAFGNVLAEAMACNTPVIATDCPSGPSEILENGRWGRLVPPGDVDGLTKAMAATLDESHHPEVVERANEFCIDNASIKYLQALLG